jgi:predicted O-methyltransferase YrrM
MATTSTPLTPELNDYIIELFSAEDDFLSALRVDAEEAGIPAIHIAPEQTSFLQVLLRSIGARFVLEIGSLAGYSAIAMARALPPDGRLIAMEIHPDYAAFIERKAHEAGLDGVIKVIVGPALDGLSALPADTMFDAVFIDADKPNYVNYIQAVLPFMRHGGIIIGDNALAWGEAANPSTSFEPENVQGIRSFNSFVASHPRLQATLVPLGDGMTIATVLSP